MPPPDDNDDDDDRSRRNLAVLGAVVALLLISWLLIHLYTKNQDMENCRLEGRHDCDTIAVPNQ